MTTNAVYITVDAERVLPTLQQEAAERVNSAEGEMTLDFSAVARIDPAVVGALEALAARAEQRSVKLRLRGVNVDVYKVLKLLKLTQRFCFTN